LCKDPAGKAPVADISANQGPLFQAGTVPFRVDEDRTGGSAINVRITGTCVQYPGIRGGAALGDASTPGTPASSVAESAHGGTCSHVAVAKGT